jgi:hypothetical protein
MEVGTVQCSARIAEVRVELAGLLDFGRCAIGGKMDMFGVERACETVEDSVDRPSAMSEKG